MEKTDRAGQGHPVPVTLALLCFLKSKLSWVRKHLHLYPPDCRLIFCLWNKGRQWGRKDWALPTGDPGSLGQQKKQRYSFRSPLEFWGQGNPLQKQHGASQGDPDPILATWSQNIPAERTKMQQCLIQSKFAALLKIPITEPLEPKELRISALAYPQLDPLITWKLHGFLDTRVLSLWPPFPSKNKNKSPLGYMGILFP